MDPYAGLVALAEAERDLARAGEWEAVAEAMAERVRAAAALPPVPPAWARPQLERLAALHAEVTRLLHAGRAEVAAELARLDRGRTLVRGYGAAA